MFVSTKRKDYTKGGQRVYRHSRQLGMAYTFREFSMVSLSLSSESNQIIGSLGLDLPRCVGPVGRFRSKNLHTIRFPVGGIIELLPKTSWATTWDVLDGPNKFLMSDPKTAIGGMSIYP